MYIHFNRLNAGIGGEHLINLGQRFQVNGVPDLSLIGYIIFIIIAHSAPKNFKLFDPKFFFDGVKNIIILSPIR